MNLSSLRSRLFLVIVGPLVIAGCLSSIARYRQFADLSRELYDNALFSVALTISRDVTINEGDLLTKTLLDALVRSLGDNIFYRITGPDGAYVTGYSEAPQKPELMAARPGEPVYYDAVYMGQDVRALVLQEYVNDFSSRGLVTVDIWQTVHQRENLSFKLVSQSIAYFTALVSVAALLVWFGINFGLKPLLSLESAILARTPDDLQPIKRRVPKELNTLVGAMNALFGRLTEAFAARDAFISDAAHQVRTPIAGVQAQAEAALSARDEATMRERVTEVVTAARSASRLTNQLLSMERVRGRRLRSLVAQIDLVEVVADTTRSFAERVLPKGMEVDFQVERNPRPVIGDQVLLAEMLTNVLENAERYCTANVPAVSVTLRFLSDMVELDVHDNGQGIPAELRQRVFDRFFRVALTDSEGCGLGLSIVMDIARLHHGNVEVVPAPTGCLIRMTLGY